MLPIIWHKLQTQDKGKFFDIMGMIYKGFIIIRQTEKVRTLE